MIRIKSSYGFQILGFDGCPTLYFGEHGDELTPSEAWNFTQIGQMGIIMQQTLTVVSSSAFWETHLENQKRPINPHKGSIVKKNAYNGELCVR